MFNFVVETLPVIIFFIIYKISGLMGATLAMLVIMPICIIASYIKTGKINRMTLMSFILLLISYCLTLISGDTTFIKLKPTIFYLLFAMILFVSNFYKRPAISYLFKKIAKMDNRHWSILNNRFMYFFITMAIVNEVIWRNFDENIWVNFKVFAVLPMLLLFTSFQIPFLMKYQIRNDKDIIV